MCMTNEIQPLCGFPHRFSPTWQAQVCHNPLQKDVSTQVWQATANTNMMFDKQFYKQVLAELQWTNSSNSFLLEIYKLLHASEITSNRFYKYHRIYFVHKTQRILFTRLKHWRAHQCQKTGIWEYDCNSSTTVLNIMWARPGCKTFWKITAKLWP